MSACHPEVASGSHSWLSLLRNLKSEPRMSPLHLRDSSWLHYPARLARDRMQGGWQP